VVASRAGCAAGGYQRELGVDLRKRFLSRSGDDGTLGREPRAVARTIPGAFRIVPTDDAPHVRAGGGDHRQYAVRRAIRNHLLPVVFDDAPMTAFHGAQ